MFNLSCVPIIPTNKLTTTLLLFKTTEKYLILSIWFSLPPVSAYIYLYYNIMYTNCKRTIIRSIYKYFLDCDLVKKLSRILFKLYSLKFLFKTNVLNHCLPIGNRYAFIIMKRVLLDKFAKYNIQEGWILFVIRTDGKILTVRCEADQG